MTCVTTDPRKATLFAFADLESEVMLNIKPEDFLKHVEISVTLTKSKAVMTAMGVTFPTAGVSKGEMNDWFRLLSPLPNDFNVKYLKAILE